MDAPASQENKTPAAAPQPAAPPAKNRIIPKIILVCALVAAAYFGIPYYFHAISHESTDDAYVDAHVISISPRIAGHVASVAVKDNQWVKQGDLLVELDPADYQNRLESADAMQEAAKASARARRLDIDVSNITSSATLVDAAAAVESAKAMVASAKSQAASAVGMRDAAKSQIASAQGEWDEAKADADSAEAKHDRDLADRKRMEAMAAEKTISKQEAEHAIAEEQVSAADLDSARRKAQSKEALVRQAEAALKSAEDNLRQAQSEISARQAQYDQMVAKLGGAQIGPKQVEQTVSQADVYKAVLDKAAADVGQAQLNLSYTKIPAPADGYITRKGVEPGSYVQVGQPLMAIVTPDFWVTANFKETQLTKMKPGQPVAITVDVYPGVKFKAHVESIQRGTGSRFSLLPPENATGNFVKVVQRVPVKIVFDDQEQLKAHPVSPGMSVVPDVDITAPGAPPKN